MMTPTQPASPLPWRKDTGRILDANGVPVAIIYWAPSRWQADAALIVRAVNAHDALVDLASNAAELAGRLLRTLKRSEDAGLHYHACSVAAASIAALTAAGEGA